MKSHLKNCFFILAGLALAASASALPKGAKVVGEIDVTKYLGKWYEIARADFIFERGLSNSTAEYSLSEKGDIRVVNRGYDAKRAKWKKAEAKARFRSDARNGELEVSFFGPFYSEYNIVALDEDYRYALIVGKTAKYAWILSRERTIPDDVKNDYLEIARSIGVDVNSLIWVEQTD
jgi:apolipoprotein D and lipocalin family protein